MVALSKTQLCNLGLSRIRAPAITTFEENSLEARECRRFYPILLSLVLEGMDFSFAMQRASLVATTNNRAAEWAYAFALPANMGSAIRVIPDETALGAYFPFPVEGSPYAETWGFGDGNYSMDYIIETNILYTNTSAAVLQYTINDIDGVAIPAMVEMAIAVQLGAWLAVPVKGDKAREKELIADTEMAWQRALADDMNRQPRRQGNFMSEAMMARSSGTY